MDVRDSKLLEHIREKYKDNYPEILIRMANRLKAHERDLSRTSVELSFLKNPDTTGG
jgi:hypothetical protein